MKRAQQDEYAVAGDVFHLDGGDATGVATSGVVSATGLRRA